MRKKIAIVIMAGILVGGLESAVSLTPTVTLAAGSKEVASESNIWKDYLDCRSGEESRRVLERFIMDNVCILPDSSLEGIITDYFGVSPDAKDASGQVAASAEILGTWKGALGDFDVTMTLDEEGFHLSYNEEDGASFTGTYEVSDDLLYLQVNGETLISFQVSKDAKTLVSSAGNLTKSGQASEEDPDDIPASLYRYSFQTEVNGAEYGFVQYTAVVDQGAAKGGVAVLVPKGMRFVTGYGQVTEGYKAYSSMAEAMRNGVDFSNLSEGLLKGLPENSVVCWSANGTGTYTFTAEVVGEASDAVWLIGENGYAGSEDITDTSTIPEDDLDSGMMVGGTRTWQSNEQEDHGTLDTGLYVKLRRK